ncbi:MAG: hypothetical protein RRZ24_01950, partial [Clostridia bacterium]
VFDIMAALPIYAFVAGFGFAFVGFSFLTKRSESDFYHSLPIRRVNLYLSITLAAFTWVAATVILSVIALTVVLLAGGIPFVPAYLPMGALFFIVATMLVFAAAAIGCSLTGTLFTNIIVTLLVLFLPRYLLFMIGRGIVANVNIVGWLDLPWLLNPATNIATGLVVMFSRQMFIERIVATGPILYSLGIAIAELALGALLFVRRSSELAEQGASSGKLQTIFACLLTLPVLLLSLVITSRYGTFDPYSVLFAHLRELLILVAVALAGYVGYQLIVLRNLKRMLLSLPWFLCPVVATGLMLIGIQGISNNVLNVCPAAADISYITFGGEDIYEHHKHYTTLLLSEIHFSEESVKEVVAENLAKAIDIRNGKGIAATFDREYQFYSIEPICIVLNNGRKIKRTIEFSNTDVLNAAREQNPAFVSAIHAFPPAKSVTFRTTDCGMSTEEVEKLRVCYFDECAKKKIIPNVYYRSHKNIIDEREKYLYAAGDQQYIGSFTIGGYVGTNRYVENYIINLETPKTAELWMMLTNRKAVADNTLQMMNAYERVKTNGDMEDSFNINMTFMNVPLKENQVFQIDLGLYLSKYNMEIDETYQLYKDYAERMMDIFKRGMLTTNPTCLNVSFSWGARANEQSLGYYGSNKYWSSPYIGFSAADEKLLLEVINEWRAAEYNSYNNNAVDPLDPEMSDVALPAAPTPMPVNEQH